MCGTATVVASRVCPVSKIGLRARTSPASGRRRAGTKRHTYFCSRCDWRNMFVSTTAYSGPMNKGHDLQVCIGARLPAALLRSVRSQQVPHTGHSDVRTDLQSMTTDCLSNVAKKA